MIQKPMRQVGRIFGAPVVVEGRTWLPLVPFITWGIMTWLAGRRKKQRSLIYRMTVGAVTMPIVLGSEWGHNLAHAAAAGLVGKPADGIMIVGGMPRLIYKDVNDRTVTPKQHILRAMGGPAFNLGLLLLSFIYRRMTPPNSLGREATDMAVKTNAFIGMVALLPIPGIDGGPILKWWLVHRGRDVVKADSIIRKINGSMGCGMSTLAVILAKERRWVWAVLLALFGGTSLGVASGFIKEQAE